MFEKYTHCGEYDTAEVREKFFRAMDFEKGKTYSNGVDTIKIYEAGDYLGVSFVGIIDGKEVYDVWQDGFEFYFNSERYILAAAGFVEVV